MPFRELLREYPGTPRVAPRMAFSLRERFFQNWGGSQVSEFSILSTFAGFQAFSIPYRPDRIPTRMRVFAILFEALLIEIQEKKRKPPFSKDIPCYRSTKEI